MKFSTLSKAGFAASLCAALTGLSTGSQAGTLQDTIFAKVEPSLRDRMFFRLAYINANVKTTAKDARDETGPVLARSDFANYLYTSTFVSGFRDLITDSSLDEMYAPENSPDGVGTITNSLVSYFDTQANASGCDRLREGLGTPCGIKAKASARAASVGLTLGYYLDEDAGWALEALVLGRPVQSAVYGDGSNLLNGKKILESKLLPPIVKFGHYFGDAHSFVRPYVGLAASYAIFFDAKATQELNAYQGGTSAGDTTVSVKNVFGVGGFVGLNLQPSENPWHFEFSVGKIRFKTEATLVTRNTRITADSQVLTEYGPIIANAIRSGTNTFTSGGQSSIVVKADNVPEGFKAGDRVKITTALMCDLARAKAGSNDCNLGTYVRKSAVTLDTTMMLFSVGRSF